MTERKLIDVYGLDAPPQVQDLLSHLHNTSLKQEAELYKPGGDRDRLKEVKRQDGEDEWKRQFDSLMKDKLISLEPDKSLFVYLLLRAMNALNVIEAGTSMGVSTIYLALAVGQNAALKGIKPSQPLAAKVIATENEHDKVTKAIAHWNQAGPVVEPWIELREGILLETLTENLPDQIDFVLFDIWTPLVLPTLKLLEDKLRPGAVLVADNVRYAEEGYSEYFEYMASKNDLYHSVTLPYSGGLEMTVYKGKD